MSVAMAKQQETTTTSAQSWSTMEELLLACAVNRHGTKSWECVAVELQNRLAWLTPQLCEEKFDDLTRRFMSENDGDFSAEDLVPMVDRLRRIRVEELRREVRQRDDSIVSLELKLKRLEEERARRLTEEADLGRDPDIKPPAGEEDSGERDDRSFNESNSTSQKPEPTTEIVKNEKNDVVEADAGGETRERKALVKTEPNRKEPEPVRTEDEPTVGRVDDDDDNKKQSSDVQSSASLSKKKRPRKKGAAAVGNSSGDDPERDEVSAANKRTPAVKCEPLIKLLEMIRSHRLGSAFERRQRSQESERYKALIKQHIDLQTIQSRLEKGLYSDYTQKFFRDLFLLFNNVMIFHRKTSQEHIAAKELLALVRKEMATIPITKPAVEPATVKSEPEKQRTLLSKPGKSSTVVACGKRSSVKALTDIVAPKGDIKKEEKVESEKKGDGSLVVGGEEKGIRKKRSKEMAVTGQRNSKTANNKSGEAKAKPEFGGNEISSHDATTEEVVVKTEKKENVVKKKQGAASFLKRIKQNSPSEVTKNEVMTKTKNDEKEDDNSEDESKDEKEEEEEVEKKGKGRKKEVGAKKEKITRSSGGRGAREETGNGRGKRGGGRGRPPKRGAPAPPPAVETSTVKRGRENGENEAGTGSRARKRSRR